MFGSIRLCLVALPLALTAISSPSAAGTITFNWFGVVDDIAPGTTPGVVLGETMRISVTLGDDVEDGDPSPEIGRYVSANTSPHVLVLAVDVGGRTDTGMLQEATVENDHNGKDTFSVQGESPHIGITFEFDFSTSDLGVFSSDAIPLSLIPEDFDTARFTIYQHGGPPLFSGKLVTTTTPIPGSVGLLASALAGLLGAGWLKMRRQWKSGSLLFRSSVFGARYEEHSPDPDIGFLGRCRAGSPRNSAPQATVQ
jgi:hypothetical protein